jgi:glycosyltransferase involved in cell wall biosynthesis
MKILVVHNGYGRFSGEEAVVEAQCQLLGERGHRVSRFTRTSADIPRMRFGKVRAFFSGIYSHASARCMQQRLEVDRPELVHVHNLYPLISPSVLGVCRRAGVPVVMTLHNYRMLCPTGLHLRGGRICEECIGGREYRCVLHNCENNLAKSVGYAARNYFARRWRVFDSVSVFAVLTDFQRRRLVAQGFPADRFVVIPNMATDMGEL